MDTTQIVAVSIGCFFILLLLGLVFWRRNLTSAEYTFARIILALAVACVAVILTGYLEVRYKDFIQAGGALGVFIVVYLLAPAALQGTSEWHNMREMWRGVRSIYDDPEQANEDDVIHALNVVNETARLIENDPSLLRPFVNDYGEDYCALYNKLRLNRYPISQTGRTSEASLLLPTSKLAKHIPCTA